MNISFERERFGFALRASKNKHLPIFRFYLYIGPVDISFLIDR